MRNSSTFEEGQTFYRDRKNIHNLSRKIAVERLGFLDGTAVEDVDIFIETGDIRRKVRRIVEKRVCQNFHKQGCCHTTNSVRYKTRRRVSNHMKNIFGGIPEEAVNLRTAC